MVKCLACGKENRGFWRVKPGLYRFSDCGCAVPTMKDHAIEAGMHPDYQKGERATSASMKALD